MSTFDVLRPGGGDQDTFLFAQMWEGRRGPHSWFHCCRYPPTVARRSLASIGQQRRVFLDKVAIKPGGAARSCERAVGCSPA